MTGIKKIAQLAGTSISSVSRVINNKPGVNPSVRARIESVIADHDFRPNRLARELLQGKTRMIGISLPTIHSFYAEWIAGITDICREDNYHIMIASGRGHIAEELENLNLFLEKQVEGLVYVVTDVTAEHLRHLRRVADSMPLVLVGQEIEGLDVPAVIPDHFLGAGQLMNHLASLGHRRIAHVSGPAGNHSAQLRIQAWRQVCAGHGLPCGADLLFEGDFQLPSGYACTKKILERRPWPDAVFYANDNMAIGGMRAFQEVGCRIPQDISICGFDDIEIAAYTNPPLTTVHQDYYDVGAQAAELLLSYVNNQAAPMCRLVIDQNLVVRQSTASHHGSP